MNEIGKNIRKFREEQGYTQATLAKAMGVTEQYISALERGPSKGGGRTPGKQTIQKLCDVFLIDELTLRFGERPPPHYPASPDHVLLEQEIAKLNDDELLQARLLIRKMIQEHKQEISEPLDESSV